MKATAAQLIEALGLAPLEHEGGYYRETYRTPESTAIYYLLDTETFSAMHRLAGDEVYHVYGGDPVELLLLHPDGRGELVVLGADLLAGLHQLHVVPAGVWQGSRLAVAGAWALLGTTMAPPFSFAGFELGDRAALVSEYPDFAEEIGVRCRD